MKIKIYLRSVVVWNNILFIILSYAFLYFQYITVYSGMGVDSRSLSSFVQNIYGIVPLVIFTIYTVFTLKKVSKSFLLLNILFIFLYSLFNLTIYFSKINLVILFFYSLIAYCLYQFLCNELEAAYYNSNYTDSEVFPPLLKEVNCSLSSDKLKVNGIITNWSEEGCFFKLTGESEKIEAGQYKLEAKYDGYTFVVSVQVASETRSGNGLGLKIENSAPLIKVLGWRDFCGIMMERGYAPEFLK